MAGFYDYLGQSPVPGLLRYAAMRGPPGATLQDMPDLDPLAEMIRGNRGRQLPPGLPLVVQDQIRNQPSYGEGEIMAPGPWWNRAEGGYLSKLGPQRENYLNFDRREALGIPNPDTVNPWLRAMPEGGMWSSRPAGVSPFAQPLDQPLQYPFPLY